jgi:hypothetical protein
MDLTPTPDQPARRRDRHRVGGQRSPHLAHLVGSERFKGATGKILKRAIDPGVVRRESAGR